MPLIFQNKELLELMKDFYNLTGIRMVLFDETYREMLSYPEKCIPFCCHMREFSRFYHLCCESDKNSFEICKKTQSFNMYRCHAGLIECTAPIMDNNTIIGYIMFGQVSDRKDKETLRRELMELCKDYDECEDISDKISKIKFKSSKQLIAASKILETCTSYILSKEMVKPSRVQLFNLMDTYISSHLDENISVDFLCKKFNISRTRLYELMKQYIDGGIAAYIKKKRLAKAKELLQMSDMSVSEISSAVGFSDYNYFLREFKKRYGISTKSMRNK